MDKRTREDYAEYARWVANEVGLRDWTLHLKREVAPTDDFYAQCHATRHKKHLTIEWGSPFLAASPEQRRHTVVHECLHAHFGGLEVLFDDIAKNHDSKWFTLLRWRVREIDELAVDAIAAALAQHLPLPPDVPAGRKKKRKKKGK